jgi:hypothetical protein
MATGKSGKRAVLSTACLFIRCEIFASASIAAETVGLWQVYETALRARSTSISHIPLPQRKTAGAGSALNDRDCDGANWDRKPRRCYTAPDQKASGIRLRQGFRPAAALYVR